MLIANIIPERSGYSYKQRTAAQRDSVLMELLPTLWIQPVNLCMK